MLCFCETTDLNNASNSIILKPVVTSDASTGISINIRVTSIMQVIAKKKLMY